MADSISLRPVLDRAFTVKTGGQSRGSDEVDSDRTLVEAFSDRRDELAFRALYRRHTPFLYALACRAVGRSDEEASALVQDTWVRAVDRLDRFEWRSQFRTWLAGILFNCQRERNRLRAKRRDEPLPDNLAAPVGDQHAMDLEKALNELPDGYREVVTLRYLHGYKHDEIASLLGISPGTSKSQASRGLRRLRSLLNWG